MKKRSNTSLWNYLNEQGINDSLHKDFNFHKALFYKNYDKNLKQKKRAEKRSFITAFPIPTVTQLRRLANMSDISVPEFIKAIVVAEINETTLDERIPLYQDILRTIEQCRSSIIRIEEQDTKKSIFGKSDYEKLHVLLDDLIQHINTLKPAS